MSIAKTDLKVAIKFFKIFLNLFKTFNYEIEYMLNVKLVRSRNKIHAKLYPCKVLIIITIYNYKSTK